MDHYSLLHKWRLSLEKRLDKNNKVLLQEFEKLKPTKGEPIKDRHLSLIFTSFISSSSLPLHSSANCNCRDNHSTTICVVTKNTPPTSETSICHHFVLNILSLNNDTRVWSLQILNYNGNANQLMFNNWVKYLEHEGDTNLFCARKLFFLQGTN